ncbi:riboflavin synthase subunit alpha [Marinobacter xestospongiae]|uniref:Riboflavin synthase n=1 Tax=Marinobacter xestospongiae TaxID=994319 RepID=A0ABU3VTU0_9GAMM|nr:riboflavin synthase subunit alpha [Marinobacter xestospongiae]MDV2077570.1 riboflavin synthase subunit alpha [Marinobacter xestospongiae]
MFTGIVQGIASIERIDCQPGLKTFTIRFPQAQVQKVEIGASVAIDGTCLTVTQQADDCLTFDAMQETLERTTLDDRTGGDAVNFERAARIGDEIGGHLVSGHIHTTADCIAIIRSDNNQSLTFRVRPEWMRYIFAKGFIAINGASLTVGEVGEDHFNVHLIPETLRATTFKDLQEGDRVNIEIDSQTQTIVDTLARLGYDRPPR